MITKHGHPFVELVPARGVAGLDEDRAIAVRRKLGLHGLTVRIPPDFDDPAFSREVLGLQAQEEGMSLLTRDAKLLGHPLAAA